MNCRSVKLEKKFSTARIVKGKNSDGRQHMNEKQTTQVLIALGSNLGQRARQLEDAWRILCEDVRIRPVGISRFLVTQPVGGPPGQPDFLNAAALLETSLSPIELFDLLQQIESLGGRQRHAFWGARTIDLDILLYGSAILNTSRLTIPHPRIAWRLFVLKPASEIAPDMVHPVFNLTITELLELARMNFRLAGMNNAERQNVYTNVSLI